MEIVLILAVGVLNVICFIVGAKVGQTVSRGNDIRIPNPVKGIEAHRENIEYREQQEQENIMLENINNYDGTGLGQRDL